MVSPSSKVSFKQPIIVFLDALQIHPVQEARKAHPDGHPVQVPELRRKVTRRIDDPFLILLVEQRHVVDMQLAARKETGSGPAFPPGSPPA